MSELTKAALAADEAVMSRVPDRPLDPPEIPDATDDEIRERREKALANLSDKTIQNIVSDVIMDPELVDTVRRHNVNKDTQRATEHLAVGKAFNTRIAAEIERWLEVNE